MVDYILRTADEADMYVMDFIHDHTLYAVRWEDLPGDCETALKTGGLAYFKDDRIVISEELQEAMLGHAYRTAIGETLDTVVPFCVENNRLPSVDLLLFQDWEQGQVIVKGTPV